MSLLADFLDAAASDVADLSARAAASVCDTHERVNRATSRVRQLAAFIRDPWWAAIPSSAPAEEASARTSRPADGSQEPGTSSRERHDAGDNAEHPCACDDCINEDIDAYQADLVARGIDPATHVEGEELVDVIPRAPALGGIPF